MINQKSVNDKVKYDKIKEILADMELFAEDLPVDIVKMVREFDFAILTLKESDDESYRSHFIFNPDDEKDGDLGYICLDTKDRYRRRVAIAYHFSNVLLYSNHIISEEEFLKHTNIEKEISEDECYYMALSLLCPKIDFEMTLSDNKIDKNNYKDIDDFRTLTKRYGIRVDDLLKYLRFIFDDGGFETT